MLRNYLSAALRALSRGRFYAALYITGLALGVSAALLIAPFVRAECRYDHCLPGYRDVYLLTTTKDLFDHRMASERYDNSFPDLAAKLRVQFPNIETIARVMRGSPHIRRGQVEADEMGFLWVDPTFFRVIPLRALAGDLQTALATPDGVVLTL